MLPAGNWFEALVGLQAGARCAVILRDTIGLPFSQ